MVGKQKAIGMRAQTTQQSPKFQRALTHQLNTPSAQLPETFAEAEGFESKLHLFLAGDTTSRLLTSLLCPGYSQVVGYLRLQESDIQMAPDASLVHGLSCRTTTVQRPYHPITATEKSKTTTFWDRLREASLFFQFHQST